MNSNKIYISVFLVVIGLLVFLEAQQKEPINWNPSYASTDKIPLGTLVLYKELERNFSVQPIAISPYEFFLTEPKQGAYLFINNQLHFDDAELEKLLEWVSMGNTAFFAAENFSPNLLDTLGLDMNVEVPDSGISSKPMFNLSDPAFKAEEAYLYNQQTYHFTFAKVDSNRHNIIGVSQLYNDNLKITDPQENFLEVPFGDGAIYLHSSPQVFTNNFILDKTNNTYVERALAYLPQNSELYWDAYYKAGKSFYTSPLHIVLNTRSLKWAYYCFLVGSLLFVVFEGKRKQRSIPVIDPPKNQSYQYTGTLSQLYLENKDYASIARKKITYFLSFISNKYGLRYSISNEEFLESLHLKSSVSKEDIRELFGLVDELRQGQKVTKEELLNLNRKIESFKTNNNGG